MGSYSRFLLIGAFSAIAIGYVGTRAALAWASLPDQGAQQQEGSAMMQSQSTPRSVTIVPRRLASVESARAVVGFAIRTPSATPNGFQIESIEHVASDIIPTSFIVIQYRNPSGGQVRFLSGYPVPFEGMVYRVAPENAKGTVTVQGQRAVWAKGIARATGNRQFEWDPDGPLVLQWQSGSRDDRGGPINFNLESDTLSLEALVSIANSLR